MIDPAKKTLPEYHDFFDKIPDEAWITGAYTKDSNLHCAVGHCSAKAANAGHLRDLLREAGVLEKPAYSQVPVPATISSRRYYVENINDGSHPAYQQPTPKARILAAITDAIRVQTPNLDPLR